MGSTPAACTLQPTGPASRGRLDASQSTLLSHAVGCAACSGVCSVQSSAHAVQPVPELPGSHLGGAWAQATHSEGCLGAEVQRCLGAGHTLRGLPGRRGAEVPGRRPHTQRPAWAQATHSDLLCCSPVRRPCTTMQPGPRLAGVAVAALVAGTDPASEGMRGGHTARLAPPRSRAGRAVVRRMPCSLCLSPHITHYFCTIPSDDASVPRDKRYSITCSVIYHVICHCFFCLYIIPQPDSRHGGT